MDGKEGQVRTWIKKIGPIFFKFQCYAGKNQQKIIMASALWRKLFDIFFITLQEHFLHVLRH